MKLIDISTKRYPDKFALVDDEDFNDLSRFKWSAERRELADTFYAIRRTLKEEGPSRMVRMHAQIMGAAVRRIDHKDGDGLNNTRLNLRPCTHTENMRNRRKHQDQPRSQFKGVRPMPRGRWHAAITIDRKRIHIGAFGSEEEAARAYDARAASEFGEFARKNFP